MIIVISMVSRLIHVSPNTEKCVAVGGSLVGCSTVSSMFCLGGLEDLPRLVSLGLRNPALSHSLYGLSSPTIDIASSQFLTSWPSLPQLKHKLYRRSYWKATHKIRAPKPGRYTSPPRCSSIHSRRHRYSGTITNTIFFFFFFFYFFPLFAFTYIYSSINQSMWQMFSVGPAFKGIKMIPPASHFLYYTSSTRLLSLSEIFMFF